MTNEESDYAARIVGFRLQTQFIKPATPPKTAAAVLSKVPSPTSLFLLDAQGDMMDSEHFSRWLDARLQDSPPFFVIGGAAGLPPPLRARAAGLISLSKMTFAHVAARQILTEQLFRADCLMRGHPYPK